MDYSNTKKVVIVYSTIASFIFISGTFFLIENSREIISGILFGFFIGLLMFFQMEKSLENAMTLPPERVQNFISSRYAVRMLIYAVVLYVSAKSEHLNIIGTATGLLSIRVGIFFLTLRSLVKK